MKQGVNKGRALLMARGKTQAGSSKSADFDHNADFIAFGDDYEENEEHWDDEQGCFWDVSWMRSGN